MHTPSKKRDQWITKLYWKSNGKIEIFGKKMYGKEVLLDRVFPLVSLTGQLAYVSRTKVFPTPLPMFALWVVKPHHVIPNLTLLFPKSFNGTDIFYSRAAASLVLPWVVGSLAPFWLNFSFLLFRPWSLVFFNFSFWKIKILTILKLFF